MAASAIPKLSRKLVGISISPRFREAVQIHTVETPTPGPEELLVRSKYVGINASDINWTAGRYAPRLSPPFDTGLEGLGEVVRAGENCAGRFKPGDAVSYMYGGAFSEYLTLPAKLAIPLPRADPNFVSFPISGMTASISLEKYGNLRPGSKVLVTAAAGGTGQFAVQLAKLAGCHVIGTCSTEEKVEMLRRLGCDRPINYKTEDFKSVLKEEYPQGVDVVYESVGGDVFNTCVKSLATGGRLILIGFITSYQDSNFAIKPTLPLYQILLAKSASIQGFFLNHHLKDLPSHMAKMVELYSTGKLKAQVDLGASYEKGPFKSLESVFDAVDYLYTGKSKGKVVVELNPSSSSASKL